MKECPKQTKKVKLADQEIPQTIALPEEEDINMAEVEKASTCFNALLKKWISAFGCPEELHSDQGRYFVNYLWEDLC